MTQSSGGIDRVLLVGGGNMGGAMARNWIDDGAVAREVHVLDPSPSAALAPLIADGRLRHSATVPAGVFDVVILAVKPQVMAEALPPLRPAVAGETVVISVAAGTTVAAIAAVLGDAALIVRAMPNMPALIGRGITGCYAPPGVPERAREAAAALLSACGPVVWVEREEDIDAVTAVSGSGPAYVFLLAETLAAAGEAAGLPSDLAMTLARHTVAGAGEFMIRAEDSPAGLRRNVASPGGTTEAALAVLMAPDGLGPLMREAVAAAKRRGAELSKA